jgi:hypothetical protein
VTLEGIEEQRLGKKEALAALSSPIEKLAERMKELAREFAEGAQPLNAGLAKPEQQKMLGDAKALLDKMDDLLKASELSAQQKAELAKALERAAANQELLSSSLGELSKMEDALKSGDLTEEQARQLAEALEKLAESLQQQAGNNPELAKELQKLAQAARSGDSKRMASAMRQAQQMLNTSLKGLNSQLAGLAGNMAANGMADSTLSDFAQSQMAADGSVADIQSMVDAMKGLGEFKSALTGSDAMSLSQALSTLQAAAAAGSGGRGPGMGGPGTGEGNTWEVGIDTGDQPLKEKLPGQVQPGRTLVSFYTAGGNIKNESRVELQTVLTNSQQAAKQALTDQKVPRAYEKVVKGYFENLEVQQ